MNPPLSTMQRFTIIQHNVLHWTFDRCNELCNMYRKYELPIILLNSQGLDNANKIKIHTYTTYQSNLTGERSDDVALAIKTNIEHKIHSFTSELIAVEVNTPHDPSMIATICLLPRRPYIPDQDIFQLLRHRKPTYIHGDWNAQHPSFGYTYTSTVGRGLVSRVLDGTLQHIGPHYPTRINGQSATTPRPSPQKQSCTPQHTLTARRNQH